VGQAAIVALAAGKHKEAAEQFLAFMTTKESAAKLAEFFPPTRASVLTPDVIAATSPLLTPELVTPIVDALKSTGQVFPVAKDNSKVADALNSTLDQYVYQPNADIPASVKKICDAIGPLL
jgi:multiple sugar transport system substrate-binding protein